MPASTRWIAGLAGLASLVMIGLIVASSLQMSIGAGLRATVDTLWGVTTLVDLYVGLVLAGAWIVWRERGRPAAWAWVAALALLGNLGLAVYVLIAALRSRDLRGALLGPRRA